MSTSRGCAWLIAAAGLAIAGCTTRDGKLPNDVTNALETCFNRNDANACAQLFRDDAEIFPHSREVVRGNEAIVEFFQGQIATELALDTESTTQLVRGNIAIDQGTYSVRNVRMGRNVELGNYLHVWTRDEGPWKLYRVMFNTEVAPRAEVSVGAEAAETEQPARR
jgi:ketosteroid isomerase-like protein